MLDATVTFANLFAAALLAGMLVGISLCLNPAGLDAAGFIAQHQRGTRALNTLMPIMGLLTLALTIGAAVLARTETPRLQFLILAAVMFLAGGLITRLINQPMNATVMTWSAAAPPAGWAALRDAWWRWHFVRVAGGMIGLAGVILATLQRVPAH